MVVLHRYNTIKNEQTCSIYQSIYQSVNRIFILKIRVMIVNTYNKNKHEIV